MCTPCIPRVKISRHLGVHKQAQLIQTAHVTVQYGRLNVGEHGWMIYKMLGQDTVVCIFRSYRINVSNIVRIKDNIREHLSISPIIDHIRNARRARFQSSIKRICHSTCSRRFYSLLNKFVRRNWE